MNRKPLDLSPGGENLKIRIARLYSDIFSPPSIYAIFAFIIGWSELPFWKGSLHAAIFGVFTSLLPLVYIVFQLRRGKVSDLHLSTPGERNIPYLLSVLGSAIAYLGLSAIGSSALFLNFILVIIIGLCSLTLISFRWLISAHTASVTAVTVFVGFAFNGTTALALSPLIFSTFYVRYYLKRHTFGELISGVILGFIVVMGAAGLGLVR